LWHEPSYVAIEGRQMSRRKDEASQYILAGAGTIIWASQSLHWD